MGKPRASLGAILALHVASEPPQHHSHSLSDTAQGEWSCVPLGRRENALRYPGGNQKLGDMAGLSGTVRARSAPTGTETYVCSRPDFTHPLRLPRHGRLAMLLEDAALTTAPGSQRPLRALQARSHAEFQMKKQQPKDHLQ